MVDVVRQVKPEKVEIDKDLEGLKMMLGDESDEYEVTGDKIVDFLAGVEAKVCEVTGGKVRFRESAETESLPYKQY
eukprot:CAMPEP_0170458586 /NCGR_PEP_ID=MMETSP0123-20130129/5513_1 /TAXON_ID=182087 /ORGANISM="Favella ehrenbergii, Strain Fehren 1" /LENGTH=75 /DNA_ID=CAMNT_0010722797 /DNA_START=650 /DNA_END=877 /DNA_ORIENTATION=+